MAIATITTSKTINGKTTTEIQEFEGTIAEIEQKANDAGTIVSVNVEKTKNKVEEVKVIVKSQE